MFCHRRNRKRSGLTLVETMVAVAIAALVFISVLAMLVQQTRLVVRTQERIYVNQILESRMEEIRRIPFDVGLGQTTIVMLAAASPITFVVRPGTNVNGELLRPELADTEDDFTADLRDVTGTLTVTNHPDGPDLKIVKLEVTWIPQFHTTTQTMELVSYVTKLGVNRE